MIAPIRLHMLWLWCCYFLIDHLPSKGVAAISCRDGSGADVDWWLISSVVPTGTIDYGHWISTSKNEQPVYIPKQDVNHRLCGYRRTLRQRDKEGVGSFNYASGTGGWEYGKSNGHVLWQTKHADAVAGGVSAMDNSAIWITTSCNTHGPAQVDGGLDPTCFAQGQHIQCITFDPTNIIPDAEFSWIADGDAPAAHKEFRHNDPSVTTAAVLLSQMELLALHLQVRRTQIDTTPTFLRLNDAAVNANDNGRISFIDSAALVNPRLSALTTDAASPLYAGPGTLLKSDGTILDGLGIYALKTTFPTKGNIAKAIEENVKIYDPWRTGGAAPPPPLPFPTESSFTIFSKRDDEVASLWDDIVFPLTPPAGGALPVWSISTHRTSVTVSPVSQPCACYQSGAQAAIWSGVNYDLYLTNMCRARCHPRRWAHSVRAIIAKLDAGAKICGGAKTGTSADIKKRDAALYTYLQGLTKEHDVPKGWNAVDICDNAGSWKPTDEADIKQLVLGTSGGSPGILTEPCLSKVIGVRLWTLNNGGSAHIPGVPAAGGASNPYQKTLDCDQSNVAWNDDGYVCVGDLNREANDDKTETILGGNMKRGGGASCWKSDPLRLALQGITKLHAMDAGPTAITTPPDTPPKPGEALYSHRSPSSRDGSGGIDLAAWSQSQLQQQTRTPSRNGNGNSQSESRSGMSLKGKGRNLFPVPTMASSCSALCGLDNPNANGVLCCRSCGGTGVSDDESIQSITSNVY